MLTAGDAALHVVAAEGLLGEQEIVSLTHRTQVLGFIRSAVALHLGVLALDEAP
jgi:hypothetical protein